MKNAPSKDGFGKSDRSRAPPEIVLCAGLKSSGSTWLYNVVIQILENAAGRRRGGRGVSAFYADRVDSVPRDAGDAAYVVIKTHIPSSGLLFLARYLRAKVVVTVREPRDAIASLSQRFDHSFEGSLDEVSAGAARMVALAGSRSMTLRYEDRFYQDPRTINEVAAFLGVRLTGRVANRIFQSLTREAVDRRIGLLRRKGVFGKHPDSDSFDPRTHWHPGHIGNGLIGKFRGVLSPAQAAAVLGATAKYRRRFGYRGVRQKT